MAASAVLVSWCAPLQPHDAPVSCQRSPEEALRQKTVSDPALALMATGTEVGLCIEAYEKLTGRKMPAVA